VLWVLQEPVEESKLDSSMSMVTNNLIDLYNEAAMDVSLILLSYKINLLWKCVIVDFKELSLLSAETYVI